MVSKFVIGLLAAIPAVAQVQPAVAGGQPEPAAPPTALLEEPELQQDPPVVIPTETRGDVAMARKEYRTAIDHYKAALERSAVLTNKIGVAYHQLGDLEAAKKQYEAALKLDSRYAEAMNNLGALYYARGDFKKAISYYEKSLREKPRSSSVLSNLGTAWFARKKYDKAMEAYTMALEVDPFVFDARGATGASQLQTRDITERDKYYFYLAKTYAGLGMVDKALENMRKAIEEGYKDRDDFVKDREFSKMQQLPEFKELLAYKPRVL